MSETALCFIAITATVVGIFVVAFLFYWFMVLVFWITGKVYCWYGNRELKAFFKEHGIPWEKTR
jgi:hypothetical protein